MDFPLFAILAAVALLPLPGLASWWWGRQLVAAAEDPTLPERLVANRSRVMTLWMLCGFGSGFLLSGGAIPLLLFLSYIATLIGSFPSRRKLHAESWSLGGYLGWSVRSLVAFGGPFLLIAFVPAIVVSRSGLTAWITALVLFVVLLAWQRAHHAVLLRLLEARKLDRPDLEPRLQAIVERSSVSAPDLYVLEMNGGRWANAVALPSLRPPSKVIFTRTLLDELTPAEVGGIFAHEVAHLEHFDRKKLRRAVLAQALVAFLVCTLGLLLPLLGQPWSTWIALLVAPVIIIAFGVAIIRRREHEGESDIRAVALCGDAEAVASALAKLHALAKLPRRMATEGESMSSHPSLARRLQAIRAAGGVAAVETGASVLPLVVRADGGTVLVLDRDRAHWLEGVADAPAELSADDLRLRASVVKSYAYRELTELRLDVRKKPSLVARTKSAKWTMPLERADTASIASLQSALDELDGQLGMAKGSRAGFEVAAPLVSFILFLLGMAAVRSLPAAAAAALAVFRPAASTLAGAAGASLVAAALTLATPLPVRPLLALEAATAASAIVLFWIARARRDEDGAPEAQSRLWMAIAVLAVSALPSMLGLMLTFLQRETLTGVPVGTKFPGVTVALLGVAAALVFSRHWKLSLAAIGVAFVPILLASRWAPGVSDDPLLAAAPAITLDEIELREIERVALEGYVVAVRLSPAGGAYAVQRYEGEPDDEELVPSSVLPRFEIGDLAGRRRTVEAFELAFLDDRRALVVGMSDGRSVVREVNLGGPAGSDWRVTVPHLVQPRLVVDPESSAFRLVGKDPRSRGFVRVRGRVGDDEVKEDRWTTPADLSLTFYEWYATEGARALALGMSIPQSSTLFQPWILALIDPTLLYRHELWSVGGEAPKRIASAPLTLSCAHPDFASAGVICTSMDEGTTRLFSVDLSDDSVKPLATVPYVFSAHAISAAAEQRFAAAGVHDVLLLNVAARRGGRMPIVTAGGDTTVRGVALAKGRLAVITEGESGTSVMLFEVPPS